MKPGKRRSSGVCIVGDPTVRSVFAPLVRRIPLSTPFLVLSLFGVAFVLPSISDDDSDDTADLPEETEETPVAGTPDFDMPVVAPLTSDPEFLRGPPADTTMTTTTPQTVNGFSGSDTLMADDGSAGATLNGGGDPDTFNILADAITANGERGADVVEITGREATANGNSGGDIFNFGCELLSKPT